jgi:hypothetical protein
MSSLKIDEVVRRLPDNKYNISKTMRDVGYAESTSRSGQQYERIQKAVAKAYSPETIKAKIVKAERKFIKDGDNSNLQANLTLQAKIAGLTKDNNAQQVQVNISDTLNKLRQPEVIDLSSSNSKT